MSKTRAECEAKIESLIKSWLLTTCSNIELAREILNELQPSVEPAASTKAAALDIYLHGGVTAPRSFADRWAWAYDQVALGEQEFEKRYKDKL